MTLDSLGMHAAALALPEQVADAAASVEQGIDGLPDRDRVSHVLALGMGGSGIAGDVLSVVAGPFVPVPISIAKDYELPGYVGERTLVFAISFSGNSEETVEAATEATALGAHVVAVTAGGELARLAGEWGRPVLGVPAGDPDAEQPGSVRSRCRRCSRSSRSGCSPVRGAGCKRPSSSSSDGATSSRLRATPPRRSPGASGARCRSSTAPGRSAAVAAMRWKCDVNENAKAPSFFNRVPELCHNEIAGWGQHGDVTRQVFTIVNLRHDHEHPHLARRFELVSSLEEEVVGGIEEVRAEGEGPLAQLLDLVLYGDLVSMAMAEQAGVDPGPIAALEFIKQSLAGS